MYNPRFLNNPSLLNANFRFYESNVAASHFLAWRKLMAKTVCKLLGIVFVIVGVAGFVAPHLLGAHLMPAHNLVHLVSGAIALYFGFAGSYGAAKGFCIIFGIVYLLLGVAGWFLGTGPEHLLHVGGE